MGVFFISWQLWEEMTFVLACAIVVVFLIGIYKLWRTSRQVRRQEAIDEEKRARRSTMLKTGASPGGTRHALPPPHGRGSDIPFGVRAIQTGVEVDGIWISRPTTPGHSSSSSRILLNDAAAAAAAAVKHQRRQSGEYLAQQATASASAASASSSPSSAHSHAPGSSGVVDAHSNLSTPLPRISEDATSMSTGSFGAGAGAARTGASALNRDALRQLEEIYAPTTRFAVPGSSSNNAALRPPSVNTYVPSSRVSSPSPSANLLGDHAG